MNRPSINQLIHSAVRRDLRRFDTALAHFPAENTQRAQHLFAVWKYFLNELSHHHQAETQVVWPAVRELGLPESLVRQFDAEHDALHHALEAADKAFTAFARAPSTAATQAARAAMTEVSRVCEEHLTHEDAELEPFFAKHRGTPELKAMGRKFGARPAAETGAFLAWLQDDASDAEKAALRAEIPPPVVSLLGALFGRRYRKMATVWSR